MTEEELFEQRHRLVVKSNDLIRECRFSLNVEEQRIVLYLISQLNNYSNELPLHAFRIKDFCSVCGVDYAGSYSYLRKTIKRLRDKSVWITLADGRETTVSWVEKVYMDENSGVVQVKLDEDMKPFLLQLKGKFTQYELIATLALKSKFSLRLFEILKSYQHEGTFRVSVDKLRKTLCVENEYPRFADFKRFVIDKSLVEIHRYTPLEVEYSVFRENRRAGGFLFTINGCEDWDGTYPAAEFYLKKNKKSPEIPKESQKGDTLRG